MGIFFCCVDVGGVEILVFVLQVSSFEFVMMFGCDDVIVLIVEYLMVVIYVVGIDNLIIEIDGFEVLIFDGLFLFYCCLFEVVGMRSQSGLCKIFVVIELIQIEVDGCFICIVLFFGLCVFYMIDFLIFVIGCQMIDICLDFDLFFCEFVLVCIFVMMKDVEVMWKYGFGFGGSEDNCVVFDEIELVNIFLCFFDELVCYKVFDVVGDFVLFGCLLWVYFEVEKGGYFVYFCLIEILFEYLESWIWVWVELFVVYFEVDVFELYWDYFLVFLLLLIF